jgi:hypothetical protein
MNHDMYNVLQSALNNQTPVQATVRVNWDDNTRVRVGKVDRLVHSAHRPKSDGYVTFSLQDGSYRTARLHDVLSVEGF